MPTKKTRDSLREVTYYRILYEELHEELYPEFNPRLQAQSIESNMADEHAHVARRVKALFNFVEYLL